MRIWYLIGVVFVRWIIAIIVIGIIMLLTMGMVDSGGVGTYQMEVVPDSIREPYPLIVVMDTRTSEVRILRGKEGRPFSGQERIKRDYRIGEE